MLVLWTKLPTDPIESDPLSVADSSDECSADVDPEDVVELLFEFVDELNVVLDEKPWPPLLVPVFDEEPLVTTQGPAKASAGFVAKELRNATEPKPGRSKIDEVEDVKGAKSSPT